MLRKLYASLAYRAVCNSRKLHRSLCILLNLFHGWFACWIDCAARSFDQPQHELALLAVFKNEAHILSEWIQHYRRQGVTLIVLVNNDSTDDYQEVLNPFVESGLVVLRHDPRRHSQVHLYNDQLAFLKAHARWVVVCDLDEFIYARSPFRTVQDYLKSLPFNVSSIQIPWKIFGSSGHKTQPHEGVVSGFIRRHRYEQSGNSAQLPPFMVEPAMTWCKTVGRLRRIKWIGIHHCQCHWGVNILSCHVVVPVKDWQLVSEGSLNRSALHLNHYSVQSHQYLKDVKLKRRGGGNYADEIKDYDYYMGYDVNEIVDTELSEATRVASDSHIFC